MISAQIKKGNTFLIDGLQDYLLQIVVLPQNRTIKTLKLNYYNFIESITQLLNQYAKSKCNVSFNLFMVDFYVRKFGKSSDLYRQFFGLTQSWKKFIDSKEDAKLFLSLLTQQRNNRQVIKRFVKIRKIILKTIQAKVLQQISVNHSDSISICHMLFEGQNRSKVIKKINTLFISLKRKLVNNAKVNGAVACQFFMSAVQQLQNQLDNHQVYKNKDQMGKTIKKHSEKQNKNNYQLSFSEQFANCYSKDRKIQKYQQQKQQIQNYQNYQDSRQSYEDDYINHQEQQAQWKTDGRGILNLQNAKQQLSNLEMKNKAIDAKLQGYGITKVNRYPEGWDQFLRNNRMQKQKLLNGVRG